MHPATQAGEEKPAIFGRPSRSLESVDSTNLEALRWAEEGAPEGALVVAGQQTRGRGRWGRSWLSEPGSALMFSVILRPALPLGKAGLLTTAAGIACAEAIEDLTGLGARLKWPNDVLVEGRKLAGILVESKVSGGRFDVCVVGMGVNLHWRERDIPDEIRTRATSLRAEMPPGAVVPGSGELLTSILRRFEGCYRLLPAAGGEESILLRASELSDVIGRDVILRWPDGRTTSARALGLGPGGALEVESEGARITVSVAEVERVTLG